MRGTARPSAGCVYGKAKKKDARRVGDRADGRERKAVRSRTPGPGGVEGWSPRDRFNTVETAEILGVDEKRVRVLDDRASRKFTGRLLRSLIQDPMDHIDPLEVVARCLLDPETGALLGASALLNDPDSTGGD